MKVKFRLSGKGAQAIITNVEEFGRDVEERAINEVKRWADETYRNAISQVPVDTGELKRSGGLLTLNGGKQAKVYFKAFYAPFVEFGTGDFVEVPSGLEKYANQFRGAGIRKVNLPARPFLFNNSRRNFTQMLNRLKLYINERSKK